MTHGKFPLVVGLIVVAGVQMPRSMAKMAMLLTGGTPVLRLDHYIHGRALRPGVQYAASTLLMPFAMLRQSPGVYHWLR